MEGKEGCDVCWLESVQYGGMETTPYNLKQKSQITNDTGLAFLTLKAV